MRRFTRSWYVGCAGWSIPAQYADHFTHEGSVLQRYASRFPVVEINSSFYRLHRPETYARWAASVPENFRFAVKIPRQITHQARLTSLSGVEDFLAGVNALGGKLGPLLIQLPPSLVFDCGIAEGFFTGLRARFAGRLVCEPRHPSWFTSHAEELLARFGVARAAVDPPVVGSAAEPGGWSGLVYYRLHGSPRRYYSSYSRQWLEALAVKLRTAVEKSTEVWCIFDNTANGAAIENAIEVLEIMSAAEGG